MPLVPWRETEQPTPRRRQPFRVGEEVFGLFADPKHGTAGAYGPVVSCTHREGRDGWTLVARLGGEDRSYLLTEQGHCDFVDRSALSREDRAQHGTAMVAASGADRNARAGEGR